MNTHVSRRLCGNTLATSNSVYLHHSLFKVSLIYMLVDRTTYFKYHLSLSVNDVHYFDGLAQERRNSIANTLELYLSCTNPLICQQQTALTRQPENIMPFLYVYNSTELIYRQVSNISRTSVGNQIVDHSDVVGVSPVGAAPTTSSFST